jgi:hypothetical protein
MAQDMIAVLNPEFATKLAREPFANIEDHKTRSAMYHNAGDVPIL